MYENNDKGLYKAIYVEFAMKRLTEDELLRICSRMLTYLNKKNTYDEYHKWSKQLKRELNDEEIRIAMMDEREEK